jgi:hypothetical protein
MTVKTNDITTLYGDLVTSVTSTLDGLYAADKIDGQTYAALLSGAVEKLMLTAIDTVQKQDQIDIDAAVKEQQILNMQDDLVTASKQRELTEQQIADVLKGLEIKNQQLASMILDDEIKEGTYVDQLLTTSLQRNQITTQTAEIADSTIRANTQLTDALLTSGEQRIGMQKDNEVKTEQVLMSVFEREFIQPKNLEKINSDIVLTSAQITGIQKDNEVKSEQVLMSAFEREFIQPKNLASIEKDIDVKERSTVIQEQQNTLQLALMNEEIETANKQQVLLDTEEAAKQYEVDNILPANLASINKDVEVKERSTVVQEAQLSDQLVTSAAQRDQIQKQTLNLENADLLTLAQIGKTKAETDVTVTLAAKDVDLKEAQLEQVTSETLLVKQKYVGRKQV